MSTFPSAPKSAADQRRQMVERFEDAWQRGESPSLDAYRLPADHPDATALLIDLAHIDLERRLTTGETARVESYLERYPELADDSEVVLDLILTECDIRSQQEGTVSFADYRKRFRQHRDALRQRWRTRSGRDTLAPGATSTLAATPDSDGPPSPPSWPDLPDFEVIEELGSGAMGVVYKARQRGLGRPVALKMIKDDALDADKHALFRKEADAIARMQHPNIVGVYAFGECQGRPYLAMEYLDGGSLHGRLAGKPLPSREAAGLVETLARAIHHAHERQVLHRDLKPENVLLASDGTPKVTDFGLAKRLDNTSTLIGSGAIVGTPPYMAPEQALGRSSEIGPATDVYALGAILYETLTGHPPFQAATVWDTLQQVVAVEPVSPRRRNPAVDRDLETIALKCLRKDAARRYPSALALALDLRRYQDGLPIQARPIGRVERLLRWRRRNPMLASVIAVLLIVFLGGFAGVLSQWLRAEEHSKKSEQRLTIAEDAVESSFTDVSESELLDVPGLQPLRKKLLGNSLRYYQQFLEQRRGDASSRLQLARAHNRVGGILMQVATLEEARPHFEEARDLFLQIQPGTRESRRQLAVCWRNLGIIRQTKGEFDAALADFRQARQTQQALFDEDPQDQPIHNDLARTVLALALLDRARGNRDAALHGLEEARDTRRELTAAAPENTQWQQDLAETCHWLGLVQSEVGAAQKAAESYGEGMKVLQKLVDDNPHVPRYRMDLTRTAVDLGRLLETRGDIPGATRRFEQAREHGRWLVQTNPQVHEYQDDLATAQHHLGMLLRGQAKLPEAQDCLEDAVRLRRQVAARQGGQKIRYNLAWSLMALGLVTAEREKVKESLPFFQEAEGILDQIVKESPDNVDAQRQVVGNQMALGAIHQLLGNLPATAVAYRRSLEAQREMLELYPNNVQMRQVFGSSHRQLGLLQRALKEPDQGAGAFATAVQIFEKLVSIDPKSATQRANLADALNHLGVSLAATGKKEEALAVHRRGLECLQPLEARAAQVLEVRQNLSYHRFNVAKLLREAGNAAEAFETTLQRRALWSGNAGELYDAAVEMAQCVPLAKDDEVRCHFADAAIVTLGDAITAGFKDGKKVQENASLEPLRSHPGFVALLRRLDRAE